MDTAETLAVDQAASAMPSDKVADLVEFIVCGLVDDEDAVTLDVTDSCLNPVASYHLNPRQFRQAVDRLNRFMK